MWFRVAKKHVFHDQRGNDLPLEPGQMVDVLNRSEAQALQAQGIIVPKEYTRADQVLEAAVPTLPPGRRRVLIWMPMRNYYSGGRVHMSQVAWCLANLGNSVTVATGTLPLWWKDYPALETLQVTLRNPTVVPDYDLIIADGKNAVAVKAAKYAERHGLPLVLWSFETPNWFRKFCPKLVKNIEYHDDYKGLFRNCALVIANSGEGRRHLREWMGTDTPPIEIIRPAINTSAIGNGPIPDDLRGRRYVASAGRADHYKHDEVGAEVACSYDGQLDFVKVGRLGSCKARTNSLHKMHVFSGIPDEVKFAIFRNAEAVLAPSSFEGFGMVPGEALAVGTPCIVYDLPVLREEYGDVLHYAKHNDPGSFVQVAHKVVKEQRRVPEDVSKTIVDFIGLDAMERAVDNTRLHYSTTVKISALMNAYACARIVPHALALVYPHVHEIIISYGREEAWPWPEDDTLEVLRNFPDPDNKIRIVGRDTWPGKDGLACRRVMREAGARFITGNYVLILDSDELWTGFGAYVEALERGKIQGGCPLAVTFWHDLEHHILSSSLARWGLRAAEQPYGAVWPHARVIPWRASYYWPHHVSPRSVATRTRVWTAKANLSTVAALGTSCVLYHMGHCMPQAFMKVKKDYYKARDKHARAADAWLQWNGKVGECGDGLVERVNWSLPDVVVQAYEAMHHAK